MTRTRTSELQGDRIAVHPRARSWGETWHRFILAIVLAAGLAPAMAAPPPPVPALPDTERRTSYSISGTTCACNVNFALYGDSTDYQNWLEVWLNGVQVQFNDATFGWTITVPTQTLATRSRPISDAILTFNGVQTGTVQIVGARRPRRASQFPENAGVAARDFNQVLTDIIAQNREIWDKTNDLTGRGFFAPPGQSGGIITGTFPGVISGPAATTDGNFAVWNGSSGAALRDGGPLPFVQASTFGVKCDSTTDNTAALNAAISAAPQTGTVGGIVQLPSGSGFCNFSGTLNLNAKIAVTIQGVAGLDGGAGTTTVLNYTGAGTRAIDARDSAGVILQNLQILYSNASFTGYLIDAGTPLA